MLEEIRKETLLENINDLHYLIEDSTNNWIKAVDLEREVDTTLTHFLETGKEWVESLIQKYTTQFSRVTELAKEEFREPLFSGKYLEIAINLGYLNIQIDKYTEAITYYLTALKYSTNPDERLQLYIAVLKTATHVCKEFPEYHTRLVELMDDAIREFIPIFSLSPSTTYVQSLLKKAGVGIELIIDSIVHTKSEKVMHQWGADALLAHLYACNMEKEKAQMHLDKLYFERSNLPIEFLEFVVIVMRQISCID